MCASWTWYGGGRAGQRQTLRADPPEIVGQLGAGRSQPPQIVEPDLRIRPNQFDVRVQIAQQTISQSVRQGAQLLFGILDHRPQCGLTGNHLRPVQPTNGQRHRVFGGEPPHRADQVHIGGQFLVAAVALDVDADRRAAGAEELRARQPERDQQNVLYAGVKRCWHLTQ